MAGGFLVQGSYQGRKGRGIVFTGGASPKEVFVTWGPVGSGADYTSDETLATELSDGETFAGKDVHILLFPDATVFLNADRTWTLDGLNSLTVQMLGSSVEQSNNRYFWWDSALPVIDSDNSARLLTIQQDGITVRFQDVEINVCIICDPITETTGGGPYEFYRWRRRKDGARDNGIKRLTDFDAVCDSLTLTAENFIIYYGTGSSTVRGIVGSVANDTRCIAKHGVLRYDSINNARGMVRATCHNVISVIENSTDALPFQDCTGDYNCSSDTTAPGANSQKSKTAAEIWTTSTFYSGLTPAVSGSRLYVRPDFRIKASGPCDGTGTAVGETTDFGGNAFGASPNIGPLSSESDVDPSAATIIAAASVGQSGFIGRNVLHRVIEYDERVDDYNDSRTFNWESRLGGVPATATDIPANAGHAGFLGLNASNEPMWIPLNGGHTANIFPHVTGLASDRSVKNFTPGRVPPIFRSLTPTGDTQSASAVITNMSSTTNVYAGASVSGTGIPADTSVLSVDSSSQITLNKNATSNGSGVTLTIKEMDCEGDWEAYHAYRNGGVITATFADDSTAKVLFYRGAAPWATSTGSTVNAERTKPLMFNLDAEAVIEADDANNAEVFPENFPLNNSARALAVPDPNGTTLHILGDNGYYGTIDGTQKASEGRMASVGTWTAISSEMIGCFADGSCFADGLDSIIFTTSTLTADGKLHRFIISTRVVSEITVTPTDANTIPTDTNISASSLCGNPRDVNTFFYTVGRDGYYTMTLDAGTFSSTKTTPTRTGENASLYPTLAVSASSFHVDLSEAFDVPNGGLILLHAPKGIYNGSVMYTKLAA